MMVVNLNKGYRVNKVMNNKIILMLCFSILLLTFVSAETYKTGNVTIQYTCTIDGAIPSAAALLNTSIYYSNGDALVNNKAAQANGQGSFSYNLIIPEAGSYIVKSFCYDGINSYGNEETIEVTPSGHPNNPNFYYLIFVISLGVMILGFAIKNAPITILGSFGGIYLGLYVILNGINGIKDNVYTWGFGIILLAVFGYIAIKSSYEMIEDM